MGTNGHGRALRLDHLRASADMAGASPLFAPWIYVCLTFALLPSCAENSNKTVATDSVHSEPARVSDPPQSHSPQRASPSDSPGVAASQPSPVATTQPASPAFAAFDTTLHKPIEPRDYLERLALDRGGDFRLMDKLLDRRTTPPPYLRPPPPPATQALIAQGVAPLADSDPFADPPSLQPKEPSIRFGIARSTYRTRESEEVLSAVQPLLDLIQRDVNVRSQPALVETAQDAYFGLLDGRQQIVVSNVFDYLTVRSWFESVEHNSTVLLLVARPAHAQPDFEQRFAESRDARRSPDTRGSLGTRITDDSTADQPGTSIVLVIAADSPHKEFRDLRNARLAVPAKYTPAPGTFLTSLLHDVGRPSKSSDHADQPTTAAAANDNSGDQPFFSAVTLRRFAKDAVIDVIKGKADVACVDEGTLAAMDRFYGISRRVRILAVSPRYNIDVLYSSVNNLETHRTEIELTERELTTLAKDPEGQEVLFFFDIESWHNYRPDAGADSISAGAAAPASNSAAAGDIDVAIRHFPEYVRFLQQTPVDLKPLLDPNAPVDRRTYDRFGDE